jgi:hypothetical protein
MTLKLNQAVTLTLQIGTAIWFIPWNAKEENGLGNVTPRLVNPYNFFPDPMATSLCNAEYIIYAVYKPVNQLKQTYPHLVEKLNGSSINYPELVSLGGSQDVGDVTNQVLVLECYLRDYTTIESEEEYDGTNEKKKVRKRKYPNGRILVIAPEIDLLLEDRANPYKQDEYPFPFVIMKNYDVPFEFWGKGEIEMLLSPQTYINELTNQIIDNAKLTANMIWVIDKNSGIGKGQLTNRPGLIIRKNPGTSVERQVPPPMPNYVREMIETLKNDIEIISGVHDVTQGRNPGSITAAAAIVALQEAAQARIRIKVKLMEHALMELGYVWYNRIRQYWLTSRSVRTYDSKNNIELVDITPDDLTEEVDFVIEAGSTMPTNKNAMLDLMIRLSQTQAQDGMPMIDRETVLAYTNVPDKDKVITRFNDLTQQRQQAEQAQIQQQQAMAEQQQAQAMAQEQMKQEHQMRLQQGSADADMQRKMMQSQQQAELDNKVNINQNITDDQIMAVIDLLKNNPQMLQELMQETFNPNNDSQQLL